MNRIVVASRNRGKVQEIRSLLGDTGLDLISLSDYPDYPEIAESGNTFLENALIKARAATERTGETALADDSGLEVQALDGAPGIRSARYAGDGADDESNIRKLILELEGVPPEQRGAAFRCVLVLFRPDGTFHSFEGRWEGQINLSAKGCGGFGYDPVFLLPEMGITVAELSEEVKNRMSHRAQAFEKLKAFLAIDPIKTGRSAVR